MWIYVGHEIQCRKVQYYACFLEAVFFHLLFNWETITGACEAKYLACTLNNDFECTKHIQNVTAKGNSRLAFMRPNLRGCPVKLKEIGSRPNSLTFRS